MGTTVIVNNLTIVHEESGGVSMVFPDVCKTPAPGGPVPIPYPNTALSKHTSGGSQTVKADGHPFMLKSSCFSQSTGDEPGSAGGVVSGKTKGKAYPKSYSFDVKVEGQNVFRLTDLMLQNGGSPTNTGPGAEVQPNQPGAAAKEAKAKAPEVTSLSWDKAEACCGDEVALKVETKEAPDQDLPVKVYRGGEKPLHDVLAAPVKGNTGQARWEVRRGAWKKEVKVAARHQNPGGKQVKSGELLVKAPVGEQRQDVSFTRTTPQREFNDITKQWKPAPAKPPFAWTVSYEIECDEKKPGRLTVLCRIDFESKEGAKPPTPAVLRRWKKSIDDVWSCRWKLHRTDCKRGDACGCQTRNGCCQWLIHVKAVFGSGHGAKVALYPGVCDAHALAQTTKRWWYSHKWWGEIHPASGQAGYPSGFVRAHEFGHIIGMYDEYEAGAVHPTGLYSNEPDSIMNAKSKVYDRHLKEFHAWFDQRFKSVVGETELLPHRA